MNESLEHTGTKGMKWGVRRYQNEDGTLTSAGRMRYLKNKHFRKKMDKDKEKRDKLAEFEATKPKAIGLNELSDEELAAKTKRITAENNYRRLEKEAVQARIDKINVDTEYKTLITPKPSKWQQAGEKILNDTLSKFGNTLAQKVADTAANQIDLLLKKAIGKDQGPRRISDLSDAELEKKVSRMKNEKMYYEMDKQIKKYKNPFAKDPTPSNNNNNNNNNNNQNNKDKDKK